MVVLVVDDSAVARQLVCHMLRKIDGITLVEACDGADALAKLDDIVADVVVTDLNMPVLDGFALIEKIRDHDALAHMPIVVLTTEGSVADRARGARLGVASFVTKPIRRDAIVDAVLAARGRKHA